MCYMAESESRKVQELQQVSTVRRWECLRAACASCMHELSPIANLSTEYHMPLISSLAPVLALVWSRRQRRLSGRFCMPIA